ncbi:MAG: hypothetical protein RR066_00465 [Mucinivorans sp.]
MKAQSVQETPNVFYGTVGLAPLFNKGVGASFSANYDRYLLKWLSVGATVQFDMHNQFPSYANTMDWQRTPQRVTELIESQDVKNPDFTGWKRANIFSLFVNLRFAPLNTKHSLLTIGGGIGMRFSTGLSYNVMYHNSGFDQNYSQSAMCSFAYNVQIQYMYKLPKRWLVGVECEMSGQTSATPTVYNSTYFTPAIIFGRRF